MATFSFIKLSQPAKTKAKPPLPNGSAKVKRPWQNVRGGLNEKLNLFLELSKTMSLPVPFCCLRLRGCASLFIFFSAMSTRLLLVICLVHYVSPDRYL